MSVRSEVIRIFNELIGQAKKIGDLPDLPTAVDNADLFEVSRGGTSYKGTGAQLPSGGGGGSVDSVAGTSNRISIGGTATDPVVDIDSAYDTAITTAIDAKVIDSIADSDTTHAPSRNAVFDALALKSDLASPTFTGTPAAPTAAPGTNTTQLATTAFVLANGGTPADASETVKGIAELATQTETNTGTDDLRIVTPLKLLVKNRKESTKTTGYTVAQTDDQGFLIANSAGAIAFDFPSLEAGTIVTLININAGDLTWTNSGGTSFVGTVTSLVGGTLGAATFRYRSTTVIEVFGGMPTQVENLTVVGSLSVKAGASAGAIAKVGGTVHVDTTQTGNVGTGEDTLFTYSVPANILNTNKDSISIVAAGSIANSINAKRLRIKFGATTILDTGAAGIPVSAAITWTLRATIIRTGAAAQKCVASLNTDNATLASYNGYVTAAETLSGAVTLLITGEATTNSDIVGEMFKITFDPAP